MRLISNSVNPAPQPTVAQVSFSSDRGFGAVSSSESRGIPIFAPRGVAYRPCEGDRMIIMNIDGSQACIGSLCVTDGLDSGEISISSAGGAKILLKNSGEVVINGLTITKDGQIIEAARR